MSAHWSAAEIASLRALYPNAPWDDIRRALPLRGPHAIREKAKGLRIARSAKARTDAHHESYLKSLATRSERRVRIHPAGQVVTHVAPEILAERDVRRAAFDARDLTATFFGDPPPGYSALDRRRA